jgi:hypothetical protein
MERPLLPQVQVLERAPPQVQVLGPPSGGGADVAHARVHVYDAGDHPVGPECHVPQHLSDKGRTQGAGDTLVGGG